MNGVPYVTTGQNIDPRQQLSWKSEKDFSERKKYFKNLFSVGKLKTKRIWSPDNVSCLSWGTTAILVYGQLLSLSTGQ